VTTVQWRRTSGDAARHALASYVDQHTDVMLGNRGGQILLRGYDGAARRLDGGANVSTGNYNLDIQSASTRHLIVRHSSGTPTLVDVTDSGVAFDDITFSGNLTSTGTGKRLLADFSNATAANRFSLQSSTVNGFTYPGILPNGTSQIAGLAVWNGSNPAAASFGDFLITSTELRILSGHAGASYLPIGLYTSNVRRLQIDTSGNFSFGTTPATTGLLRVPNNVLALAGRNAANTGDVDLIGVNGLNQVAIATLGGAAAVVIGASSTTTVGFFASAGATRRPAYTQTYATADRTLGAYTPDIESVAYVGLGSGAPGAIYAAVADLNALRAAVENLRSFAEDVAQVVNSHTDDLQSFNLAG
jgi:hypothetical protein